MVKIQAFKRANDSVIHSVTIPKDVIEESGFLKGDEVNVLCDKNGDIIISKE